MFPIRFWSLVAIKEAPTKPKFIFQRALSTRWCEHLIDATASEIRDGDQVIATLQIEVIPPRGDGSPSDRPLERLVKVILHTGQTLTRQPQGFWLTDSGMRLKHVDFNIESSDDEIITVLYAVGW